MPAPQQRQYQLRLSALTGGSQATAAQEWEALAQTCVGPATTCPTGMEDSALMEQAQAWASQRASMSKDAPAIPLLRHIYGGAEGCIIVCIGFTYQDNTLQLSVGGIGLGGWSKNAGYNFYEPNHSAPWTFGGCAADGGGACAQATMTNEGHINFGGGLTTGAGWSVGLMVSILTIHL